MTESRHYEGETAILKCDSFVHGKPRIYTYRWKRDGTSLTNVEDDTKNTLMLTMSQANEGLYSCVVRNDYGETEESAPTKLSFLIGTRPPDGMYVILLFYLNYGSCVVTCIMCFISLYNAFCIELLLKKHCQ